MSDLKQALERALVRHETPWNDDPTDTTAFYDKDELAPIHKAMLKVVEIAEQAIDGKTRLVVPGDTVHDRMVKAANWANEKLQREGVRVFLHESNATDPAINWSIYENQYHYHTHTALLIGLRMIVKDTAEDLVREIAALEMFVTKREELGERIGNIVMRARALLGSK